MNKTTQLIILLAILGLWACRENKTRIVYEDNDTIVQPNHSNDSESELNKMIAAELPFTFDNLEHLYFAVGETDESNRLKVKSFSGSYSRTSNSHSHGYFNGRKLDCDIENLLIKLQGDTTYKLLTNNVIKIKTMTYLYSFDTLYGKDRIIYKIIDSDTNKDTFLNDEDLLGLYISKTNGDDFKRISPQNHQLLDWKMIVSQGLLYFRTIEDINRNGEFDKHDRHNLYEYNMIKEDTIKLIFNDKVYSKLK